MKKPTEMQNLLEETIKTLADNGRDISEVLWVGSANSMAGGWGFPEPVYFDWIEFEALAASHNYKDCDDNLPYNLIIAGEGWWLERKYYDGCGRWIFKKYPQKPEKKIYPKSLYR